MENDDEIHDEANAATKIRARPRRVIRPSPWLFKISLNRLIFPTLLQPADVLRGGAAAGTNDLRGPGLGML